MGTWKLTSSPTGSPENFRYDTRLRFMDWQQSFDGFEPNHNQIFDYHIHPVAAIKLDSLVDNWQRNLPFDPKLLLNRLVSHALLVGRFEQPWTQDTGTSIAQRITVSVILLTLRASASPRSNEVDRLILPPAPAA
jgi:hypothetical protein